MTTTTRIEITPEQWRSLGRGLDKRQARAFASGYLDYGLETCVVSFDGQAVELEAPRDVDYLKRYIGCFHPSALREALTDCTSYLSACDPLLSRLIKALYPTTPLVGYKNAGALFIQARNGDPAFELAGYEQLCDNLNEVAQRMRGRHFRLWSDGTIDTDPCD